MKNIATYYWLVSVGMWALCGCGSATPGPVEVKGKVILLGSEEIPEMVITFYPQEKVNQATTPSGIVKKGSGEFKVKCIPGKYHVTLKRIPISGMGYTANPAENPESEPRFKRGRFPVPRVYGNAKNTPLKIVISEDQSASGLFLEVKKK